jgi:hypothetical protein
VVSFSDSDEIHATWTQPETSDPVWDESFVISTSELSNVLIQVFDSGVTPPQLLGHSVLNILHVHGHLLGSNGNAVSDSAPLKCAGVFGGQYLDYEVSTDQHRTSALAAPAAPSLLTPRGKARRVTVYTALRMAPIISFVWIAYRIETEEQSFSLIVSTPPALARQARRGGRAQAVWVVISNMVLILPSVVGYSIEFSPTRLPQPDRARDTIGDIGQLWVPESSSDQSRTVWSLVGTLLPRTVWNLVGTVLPWVAVTRSQRSILVSFNSPLLINFISGGMARTEPLELVTT